MDNEKPVGAFLFRSFVSKKRFNVQAWYSVLHKQSEHTVWVVHTVRTPTDAVSANRPGK